MVVKIPFEASIASVGALGAIDQSPGRASLPVLLPLFRSLQLAAALAAGNGLATPTPGKHTLKAGGW